MADIIPIGGTPESDDDGPWLSGEAFCSRCKHEWAAVAPVGTLELQCPACETFFGLFRNPVDPGEDVLRWACGACDGQLFYVTQAGFFCQACGKTQVF